ncbi:hypothetical protein [Nonomuraea insulae]|uniref:Secreted protein n=1 Tax=Nonomuraea insulae TaxID=1616787 RepID=A0ABW1CYM8_9ACTN
MKARQMGGACAVAIALLTTGAITGSGAAMADDHQAPSRVTVCGTGPVYRSSHVRIEVKCDIRVNVERRKHTDEPADYVADDQLLENMDELAEQ